MKQFLFLVAIVCLAVSGCAGNSLIGCGSGSQQGCHATRSQRAPRPNICRTTCRPHGSSLGLFGNRDRSCKEAECGYTDTYCDDSCCDTCATGCGCADTDCGCDDGCCGTCDGGCCVNGCSDCGGRGCGLCQRFTGQVASGFCPHGGGYPESYNFAPSPPGGQVAYPYYTVRGPRDFLRDNPPSIGPY